MTPDYLDTKSLEELDRIFAVEVCEWHEGRASDGEYPQYWYDAYGELMALSSLNLPRFTRSADAVLPLLEKHEQWRSDYFKVKARTCVVVDGWDATAPTFSHAAVIALIRAERAKKGSARV